MHIIRSDIKGPFPKLSMHKNKWVIMFICAKRNYMVVYIMKDKIETLSKFGYKMKVLQCDEDKMLTEKELKNWCVSNGVKLQTSPPYHHASNSLAERGIQTIMDKTITSSTSRIC